METVERVNKKLEELNVNSNNLKRNIWNYLMSIEDIIHKKSLKKLQLEKELHECDYNVKSIAEELEISRTIFYSYDKLLQRYIQLSHDNDYKSSSDTQIRELRARIRDLEEEKRLMMERDCRELQLKIENEELKKELSGKDKTIRDLHKRLFKK